MLGALGKFVVKVADLAEAEGRMARRHVLRVATAMLFGLAAMAVFIVGIGAACIGLYLALIESLHPAAVMAIIAAILLGLAAVLGVIAQRAAAVKGD